MKKTILLFITFLLLLSTGIAQTTLFKGTIMGFESEKTALSINKHKNLKFQGGLEDVSISYTENGKETKILSDASGDFNLFIPTVGTHRVSIKRSGYSTVVLDIFQEGKPKNYQYDGLFILLKKTDDPSIFMGTLKVTTTGKLEYRKGSIETNKSSIEYQSYNFGLGAKTASINNAHGLKKIQKQTTVTSIVDNVTTNNINGDKVLSFEDSLNLEGLTDKEIVNFLEFNGMDMDELRLSVDSAKQSLLRLDSNSIEYKHLLLQIELAEEKIKDSEIIIELKNNEISSANTIITYISLFIIVLIALALLLLFFLKQRKTFVKTLEDKNKTISTVNANLMSSIRFASLIQNSYMQKDDELKKLFPNSFIYNRPKDIVSGDFYWFGQVNNTNIVIVADCTGHGVPGAMLTVLGHSTIDSIVHDKSITKPSEVITALNKTIVNTFSSNGEYNIHGMDMTVITSKVGSNEITFSGAANGLYLHNKDGITYHDVSPYSLGQEMEINSLTDVIIKTEKGDSLFLYTDGYIDQFKGDTEKIEKYNVERFENLLTTLSKAKDYSNSCKTLDGDLNKWKVDRSQIDDILIVGIKL